MPNLYLLDVGHGNSSVLVDTKGTVVVDAGPKTGLLDFLTSHEIHEIDVLLLSHADRDHIGGAMALLLSDEMIKKLSSTNKLLECPVCTNEMRPIFLNDHFTICNLRMIL